MRNLKKFLAVVVAIAVMLTAMVPAFAADATATASTISTDAQACKTLKVLVGGSDGVTSEYLALGTQRIQAAVLLLRLMGKEAEARAYTATTTNFKDVAQVGGDNVNLMAYLKAHPEYGFGGYTNGNFGVKDPISAQQFYKVLLVVQGYEITSANYGDTLKTASANGMTKIASITKLTNDNVATALVEGLKAKVKDGSKTLVEKLIADKIVAEADAQAANVMPVLAKPTSVSIAGAGAKKLAVTFNGAVAVTSKMAISVTRDGAKVVTTDVSWSADKKVATLTTSYNLISSDNYVVSATYDTDAALVSANTKISESKISKVVFASKNAVMKTVAPATTTKNAVTVSLKFENQYGEDISSSVSSSDLSVSASKGTFNTSNGYDNSAEIVTLTDTAEYVVNNVPLTVTVVHKSTATVGSETFTVVQAADAASIELGDITSDDTTVNTLPVNKGSNLANYYLPITVKDQYGNVMDANSINTYTKLSSDATIVSLGAIQKNSKLNATVLYLADTDKDGTAVITVVSPNGKSASKTITVNKNSTIDTVNLDTPSNLLKQGVEIEIPFTAVDQFGKQLTSDSELGYNTGLLTANTTQTLSGATFNVTNGKIRFTVDYANKNKVKLMLTPDTGVSVVTFTITTATPKVFTKNYSVSNAPVPTAVKELGTDFVRAIQIDSSLTQKFDNDLIFADQYGDDISLPTGYSIKLAVNSGSGNVATSAGSTTYSAANLKNITFQAVTAGTTAFEVSLIKDSDGTTVNKYAFNVEAVREDDITGYTVSDIGDKIYSGKLTSMGAIVPGNTDHDKTFSVKGLKGSTVVLVPGSVVKAASTDVGNITASTARVIHVANEVDTSSADKTGKLTAVISNSKGGYYTIEKTFTYSNAAPVATTIKTLKESDDSEVTDGVYYITTANAINGISVNKLTGSTSGGGVYFSVKDQYNTAINNNNTFAVTNVTSGAAVDLTPAVTTGAITVTTLAAGQGFTYTVIANGKVKSIKVVVQP